MRLLIPILLILASGCSTRKPKPLVLHLHPEPVGVRFPEVLQTYQLGRQVDASGRLHEAHPIHRIEMEARWDLRPGQGARYPGFLPPPAAYQPAPVNDAIVAELRHQQDQTQRVIEEASRLAESVSAFQPVITNMARVAREHATVGASLRAMEERQARLEQQLQRIASPANP